MPVLYTCPGVGSYGRGLTMRFIHNGGCCASFAALDPEQRAAKGLHTPVPAPQLVRREHPGVDAITVAQLIALVADLQRKSETNYYVGTPEPIIVWLDNGPDDDMDQVRALIELGEPYGLVVSWRGYPAPHPKGTP